MIIIVSIYNALCESLRAIDRKAFNLVQIRLRLITIVFHTGG